MIVAVDGPVAAGKGTLARRLAAYFNFAYLDSGSLYRAVAAGLLRSGGDPADPVQAEAAARGIDAADLSNPVLRDEAVGAAASLVAAMPAVRARLLAYQRNFAQQPPGGNKGAVLDGRDIGTVVCPDADIKIFVTASPAVRARRRHLELRDKGVHVSREKVLADLLARDTRDADRAIAPLRPAADAHLLDTTNLDIEAAFAVARDLVARRLSSPTIR